MVNTPYPALPARLRRNHKLNSQTIGYIRKLVKLGKFSISELARRYHVSYHTIKWHTDPEFRIKQTIAIDNWKRNKTENSEEYRENVRVYNNDWIIKRKKRYPELKLYYRCIQKRWDLGHPIFCVSCGTKGFPKSRQTKHCWIHHQCPECHYLGIHYNQCKTKKLKKIPHSKSPPFFSTMSHTERENVEDVGILTYECYGLDCNSEIKKRELLIQKVVELKKKIKLVEMTIR